MRLTRLGIEVDLAAAQVKAAMDRMHRIFQREVNLGRSRVQMQMEPLWSRLLRNSGISAK
jgi:hypothetical protein